MKQELIDEAPTGTMGIAQESGWMTTVVFYKWFVHFQLHVKASLDDKVLLIVDGHISHKGIESLTFAKKHEIIMVCLPPHCTHRMQPLDVSFYGPLKTYFNQEVSTWLKSHPGRVVTHFEIGAILNKAYVKAATVQTAVNGLKKTGLWPVDPYIFPDYLVEPAETTTRSGRARRRFNGSRKPMHTLSGSISGRSRKFDITNNCKHISRRQPTSTLSSPILRHSYCNTYDTHII
ncbi:unnamed protein product [Parnassius apollo]|uniref:(apollo) hypothetical protein n=1 Tax=Parnassius apollo TaxID=110799 RepID=A0A8S3X5V9_PARAO|nr:unnamed protein product [Parnassius apollo]